MDKLDFNAIPVFNSSSRPNTETRKTKADLKSSKKRTYFSELLESTVGKGDLGPVRETIPSEEALTELMDEVHSAGSDLKDRPFHDEILRYKKAVRNFIHYVVENGFSIEKFHTRRRGKEKIHVQIQVIDRKLEELAAAILSGQTTQLQRVSKLDEITGLLVDLTVTGMIKERDD